MTNKAVRYVGNPDFHDGYIRAVSRHQDTVLVTVDGDSGKHYEIVFQGVSSVELQSAQDMMLYALSEAATDVESLHLYDFINWYYDEPEEEESKSFLRIIANRFTITESS